MLNSNIRCIEISVMSVDNDVGEGWIVTLDVLKLKCTWISVSYFWLNSNIRCIEMGELEFLTNMGLALNSNIRCIEIF